MSSRPGMAWFDSLLLGSAVKLRLSRTDPGALPTTLPGPGAALGMSGTQRNKWGNAKGEQHRYESAAVEEVLYITVRLGAPTVVTASGVQPVWTLTVDDCPTAMNGSSGLTAAFVGKRQFPASAGAVASE